MDEILREDDRRMAERLRPYDPLEGSQEGKIDEERCRNDFAYWAAACCRIKNKKAGPDIPFILNSPQRKLVKALEEQRLAGQPIRLILLKARQWGGSTCTQLYMAWLQLMHKEGLNSLIVAQQHSATAEIRNMFLRMIESYPKEMLKESESKRTVNAGPGAFKVPANNFQVKVGSAERPDSCRGGDYSLVHCSEVALWKKSRLHTPENMMKSACSGVLLEPYTMILLESTANGTGSFFHTEYESAKEGKSQFKSLFVAWYEIEQYALPFGEGEREEFARALWEGRHNEQQEDPRSQPGAYLWWLWERGATLEALHWYVRERRKYSDHGHMASEYPSDDVEAFVHSGARVFDKYKVEKFRSACSMMPIRGEISGKESSGPGSLTDVKFEKDNQGNLKVWKLPEKSTTERVTDRYLVVVDIGGRSDKADWSVIAVFDRASMIEGVGPEIAAQWRGHTDFDLLAWNAARIAKFYDEALLVIESNTLETHDMDRLVDGDQSYFLLNQLRRYYSHLYARKRSPEDIRQGAPVKYGFHTNVATKPLIITNLVRVVREGLYIERDGNCLDEYLTYEQRPNGSYGAIIGKHDDLLMTRAIGLHIALNEMAFPKRVLKGDGDYISPRRGNFGSF